MGTIAQNIFHHHQSASNPPESSPIAPLTSSQQRRMHFHTPQNLGSRGGVRLRYLCAQRARSPPQV
ncbi:MULTISPECIES: hypothetical protein [unclassified Microcoleus]|uniref:hypothetical protein n=1 Tax=unclassified Microcoleus TaxID=2642155 RepID=UPI002FCFF794